MNTATVIGCIVIAAIILAVFGGMIRNVKKGNSFCGAELSEPLNTKDVAQIQKEQKSINVNIQERIEKHLSNN